MHQIIILPKALEDLSRLDNPIAKKVLKKIDWLSQNFEILIPTPLKGKFEGIYKLRVGDWRILYTFDSNKKLITIHLIRHRREVYKEKLMDGIDR